jgi:hypothetical protein
MMRETVHYHQGRAPVTRQDIQRADVIEQYAGEVSTSEVWTGPEQELRARLRDEARDRRVKPYGDPLDRPGLPRGWVAMRVYLTDTELSRVSKPRPRVSRAAWVALGIGSILSGVTALAYWAYLQIAALVAGATAGMGVAAGFILVLLLAAAGGTTVITVVTQVTVKRSWW